MTKSANIESIEKTTGKSWNEWVEFLDTVGGRGMEHKSIADRVRIELHDTIENVGWWAQGITVAYEQHIGRREPGQRSDGTFDAAVSRTFDGTMDEIIARWTKYVADKTEFNSIERSGEPSSSSAERSRHWGCNLADGTRVNADTYPKSPEKTIFTITHIRLPNSETATAWRTYWKTIIEEL